MIGTLIVEKILEGDIRTAARVISKIDNGEPESIEILKELHKYGGNSHIIGITGNPGSGKSTIINSLITLYRKEEKRIGVVAVDPSSPFSGGAILGDRIRMQEHSNDPDVFVRSVATRGNLGGVSASTSSIVRVMEAMGKDIIIIETVGVGQDEIDIIKLAQTTVVVTVPGLGDDIQAIKAGIFEIADIFVVNKADREGVDKTIRDLKLMLELKGSIEEGWTPPVVSTIGTSNKGIFDLKDELERHREHNLRFCRSDYLNARRDIIELKDILKSYVNHNIDNILKREIGDTEELIRLLSSKTRDPYTIAEDIIKKVFC